MKNKEFNGFATEEQYVAVFNAVKSAIVNFDDLDYFAVYGYPDTTDIDVQIGTGLSLCICEDGSIQDIECDYPFNMFEVEMIQDIYENAESILAVYEQYQPKEANA